MDDARSFVTIESLIDALVPPKPLYNWPIRLLMTSQERSAALPGNPTDLAALRERSIFLDEDETDRAGFALDVIAAWAAPGKDALRTTHARAHMQEFKTETLLSHKQLALIKDISAQLGYHPLTVATIASFWRVEEYSDNVWPDIGRAIERDEQIAWDFDEAQQLNAAGVGLNRQHANVLRALRRITKRSLSIADRQRYLDLAIQRRGRGPLDLEVFDYLWRRIPRGGNLFASTGRRHPIRSIFASLMLVQQQGTCFVLHDMYRLVIGAELKENENGAANRHRDLLSAADLLDKNQMLTICADENFKVDPGDPHTPCSERCRLDLRLRTDANHFGLTTAERNLLNDYFLDELHHHVKATTVLPELAGAEKGLLTCLGFLQAQLDCEREVGSRLPFLPESNRFYSGGMVYGRDDLIGNSHRLLALFPARNDDPELDYLGRVIRRAAHRWSIDRRQLVAQLLQRAREEGLGSVAAKLRGSARRMSQGRFLVSRPFEDDGSSGLIMIIDGHRGPVIGAIHLPDFADGPRILSWSYDETIRWWDASTGTPIGQPMEHNGSVEGAAYVPDFPGGPRILSWSGDHNSPPVDSTIRWWNAVTGTPIGHPMKHRGHVKGAAYVPDFPGGPRILSWSGDYNSRPGDSTIRWWNAVTGTPTGQSLEHDCYVNGATYLPDFPNGPSILSWAGDGTIRLWDAATGTPIRQDMKHDGCVNGATYLPDFPDGPRLLSWSQDGTIRWWNAVTGTPIGQPMRHHERREWVGGATYVPIAPGGPRILSWSNNPNNRRGAIRWWDAATGTPIGQPMEQGDSVEGAAYVPDFPGGARILSWSGWIGRSGYGTIRWWDAVTGAPIGQPMEHDGPVKGVTHVPSAPGGSRILSWSMDRTIRWWDTARDAPVRHDGRVKGAIYLSHFPDGPRILSWSMRGTIRWWNAADGTPIGQPMEHNGWVEGVTYVSNAPGGPCILSWSSSRGTGDGTIRWWDAATGTPVGRAIKHNGRVKDATYVPDFPGGARILSWSGDDICWLHPITGAPIGPPIKHPEVEGAIYLPYDSRILSWSFDEQTIRMWNAFTGAPIGQPMEHDAAVEGVCYVHDFPNGPRILSWSGDGTIRWWDAVTGAPIGRPMEHGDWVEGACYVPDFPGNPRILSWSGVPIEGGAIGYGTIRWWDAVTGAPIGKFMKHDGWIRGAHYLPDFPGGPRILSWSDDKTVRWWNAVTQSEEAPPITLDGSPVLIVLEHLAGEPYLIAFTDRPHFFAWKNN